VKFITRLPYSLYEWIFFPLSATKEESRILLAAPSPIPSFYPIASPAASPSVYSAPAASPAASPSVYSAPSVYPASAPNAAASLPGILKTNGYAYQATVTSCASMAIVSLNAFQIGSCMSVGNNFQKMVMSNDITNPNKLYYTFVQYSDAGCTNAIGTQPMTTIPTNGACATNSTMAFGWIGHEPTSADFKLGVPGFWDK
jgi:hypothetical protein